MPYPVQLPHADPDVGSQIDRLAGVDAVQSNCMFQLAMMLARIAIEPCSEAYKDEAAEEMLALMRKKPKTNVVRLFDANAAALAQGRRLTSR